MKRFVGNDGMSIMRRRFAFAQAEVFGDSVPVDPHDWDVILDTEAIERDYFLAPGTLEGFDRDMAESYLGLEPGSLASYEIVEEVR